MSRRILFFYVTFFAINAYAQDFDSRITKSSLTIDGLAREGFVTRFDISAKKLERAWWSYSREFGRPLNMKGYYQVTIPNQLNSGNVDMVLLSKSMSNKNGSSFFLTIDEKDIPKDKLGSYLSQVELILQTFKVNYSVGILEEKLQNLEKRAAVISKRVAKSSGNSKQKHLTELQKLESEIDDIKSSIAEINNAY